MEAISLVSPEDPFADLAVGGKVAEVINDCDRVLEILGDIANKTEKSIFACGDSFEIKKKLHR